MQLRAVTLSSRCLDTHLLKNVFERVMRIAIVSVIQFIHILLANSNRKFCKLGRFSGANITNSLTMLSRPPSL